MKDFGADYCTWPLKKEMIDATGVGESCGCNCDDVLIFLRQVFRVRFGTTPKSLAMIRQGNHKQ